MERTPSGISLLSLFYLCAVLAVSGCSSAFIYHPDPVIRQTPADLGLPFNAVHFKTEDRVRLSAWWIPAREQIGVVLFFHGNGGNISHFLDPVVVWHRMGLSTLTVDYRGYGMSEGKPNEEGTYRDALAAWDYLVTERHIDPGHIVVYGKSLGGSVAAWLAARRTPALLVIDSSFTRMAAAARELVPWAPSGLILGNAYNTRESVSAVKCPVLIIHSRDDEMIRFHHGEELFAAAPEPKELLITSGSHNGGFRQSIAVYEPGLTSFVNRYLSGR